MRELTHLELAQVHGGALGASSDSEALSAPGLLLPGQTLGFPWNLLQSTTFHTVAPHQGTALAHL